MEENQPETFINQKEAARLLGIKLVTFRKWRQRFKDFPKPYRVTNNAVHYKVSELVEWMEKRREREKSGNGF